MTLFTLLFVMALERVVPKTDALHISNICDKYFGFLAKFPFLQPAFKNKESTEHKDTKNLLSIMLVALIPTVVVWILVDSLPGFFVLLLTLLILWICIGSPATRKVYKRYLQAASRKDTEACALYSEQLGNKDGNLAKVGSLLVYINYRQYASNIIFFVALGLPGLVFYAVCKECLNYLKEKETSAASAIDETSEQSVQSSSIKVTEQIMFVLDWIPVRITSFGFLLVGNFSKGFVVWLETSMQVNMSAYSLLSKVAKASEEIQDFDHAYLQEPMQLVKLVKRNIVFFLMAISVMTLAGMLG